MRKKGFPGKEEASGLRRKALEKARKREREREREREKSKGKKRGGKREGQEGEDQSSSPRNLCLERTAVRRNRVDS